MNDMADEPGSPTSETADQAAERRRRERLDEIFGDVLPQQTRDDVRTEHGRPESWYRSQVPPHHGQK